ncbi:MAG TPA: cation diffusion facilitator family transporter [Verrucomicrobiota bacterium]|nr:cation diffusion facilitator family transporter [Verrucomicrobiota bacterium]HNU52522.1 cation diffusion facilitator family transporter [Verrucomicrobiota bacterium]
MAAGVGMAVNVVLAATKIVAGIAGNSYALIADGIESTADVFSSLVVWVGLKVSSLPADADHPYGHGKAEPIAGVIVALALLGASVLIAVQSVREIVTPHHAPAWYTLLVLALVIAAKESLYRFVFKVGNELTSTAVKGDAWHHRSDALTSAAAFVGIAIALIGGKGFESADDWAALLACAVIVFNAARIFRAALGEIMDAAVPERTQNDIRTLAASVPDVVRIEKCHARKSGLGLFVEIHVEVDAELTVRRGHEIGHEVIARLKSSALSIQHVVVHIEPALDPPPGHNG